MRGRGRGRGERARQFLVKRRLEDPSPPVDFEGLRTYLRKSGRVKDEELSVYRVPRHLLRQRRQIQPYNRGLSTIYNKMGHLRRRFLKSLYHRREPSKEGAFILNKLEVFKKEVGIMCEKIENMDGEFFFMPSVFLKDLALTV